MTLEPAVDGTGTDRPTIVVGVDGSPPSAAALRWAVRQARLEQAEVVAVISWEYPPMAGWGLMVPGPEIEEAAQEALAETVTRELGPAPEVPVTQRTVCGYPAGVLLEAAKEAQLLVVGSRGLGGFAGTVLGSVGRACVEHASCPVVVVRGPSTGHHHQH